MQLLHFFLNTVWGGLLEFAIGIFLALFFKEELIPFNEISNFSLFRTIIGFLFAILGIIVTIASMLRIFVHFSHHL